MSPTDQVQELFDRAIASVSPRTPLPTTRCTLASISDGFDLGINDWRVSACGCGKRISAVIVWPPNTAFRHALLPMVRGRRARRSFRPINDDDRAFARRGFTNARLPCRTASWSYHGPRNWQVRHRFSRRHPNCSFDRWPVMPDCKAVPSHRSHFRPYARVRNNDSPTVSGFSSPSLKSDPASRPGPPPLPAQDAKSPNSWALTTAPQWRNQ